MRPFVETRMMRMMNLQEMPFGYNAIEGKVSVYDIQATILKQLGFDHEQLTYQFQGRPFRLTDVFGKPKDPIIA
jgi:Flp pilus assembly secretin CpaC